MALCLAAFVLFFVEQQTGYGGETVALWALDLATLGAALFAGVAAWRRMQDTPGPERAAWRLAGLAFLCWALGQVSWSWIELVEGRAVPTPSWPDLGYGLFLPLLAAAFAASLREGARVISRTRIILEASLTTLAVLLVIWPGVVAGAFEDPNASGLELFVNFLYPVADAILLGLLLAMLSVTPAGERQPGLWLLAGLVAFTVADIGFFGASGEGYVTGTLLDVGWFLGLLCFGLASLAPGSLQTVIGPSTLGRGLFAYGPPILAGLWALGYQLRDGVPDLTMMGILSGLLVLTGIRGLLRLQENVLLRQRLEASVKSLEEAQRQRTAFLHSVTHELKNPMVPMRIQLDLLGTGGGPTVDKRVAAIKAGLAQMDRLVEDFADLARIEGGRLRLRPAPLDLAPLLQTLAAATKDTAAAKSIRFRSSIVGPLPVVADQVRIGQVVTNFLSNALKFTPMDGQVHLTARRQGLHVIVEVLDSGRGLTPDEAAKLFRPFGQVHGPVQSPEPGTGLGLFITKNIIEAQGGRVGVASDGHGKGSRFWFQLPLGASPDVAAAPTS